MEQIVPSSLPLPFPDTSFTFGSNDGNLYSLDCESGDKLWDYDIGVPVASSPAVSGNTVYVAALDAFIQADDGNGAKGENA